MDRLKRDIRMKYVFPDTKQNTDFNKKIYGKSDWQPELANEEPEKISLISIKWSKKTECFYEPTLRPLTYLPTNSMFWTIFVNTKQ